MVQGNRRWIMPAAVIVLLTGVVAAWIALGGLRPPPPPSDAEIESAVADLGEKLEAAIVNARDPAPLLPPAELLVERRPDLPAPHRLLGQILVELRQWPDAYAAFNQALTLDPQDAQLHRLAGGVAEQTQDWPTAQRHYEAARALRPQDPQLWVRLANIAVKQERFADAQPLLDAALARQATLHEAHALRAAVLRHQGDDDAALAALEQAYNLALVEGGEPLRRYAVRLADILQQRGQLVTASKVLRLPKPEDAFVPEVMTPLGEVLAQLGLPFEAAQYFEQWVQREPLNADAAAQAVAYYLQANEATSARAMLVVLRRINARHPRLPELEAGLRQLAEHTAPDSKP